MYFDRYRCAHAYALLLGGAILAGLPAPANAASFQKGVQHTIHEVVDLIAQDAGKPGTKSEVRHLEKALNQLLDVLEHHRKHHHHKQGQMHKGAAGLQHGKGKESGSKVGASAGKKAKGSGDSALSTKRAIGGSTGKKANNPKLGQPVSTVKNGGGPIGCQSKKAGGNAGAARKSSKQQGAGNAKECGSKNRNNALAKNTGARTGKVGAALNANHKIGGKPGCPKTNQAANIKNAGGAQTKAAAPKSDPVRNLKQINDKVGGIAAKNNAKGTKNAPAAGKPTLPAPQFARSASTSRNVTPGIRSPRPSVGSTVGLRNLQPNNRRK